MSAIVGAGRNGGKSFLFAVEIYVTVLMPSARRTALDHHRAFCSTPSEEFGFIGEQYALAHFTFQALFLRRLHRIYALDAVESSRH